MRERWLSRLPPPDDGDDEQPELPRRPPGVIGYTSAGLPVVPYVPARCPQCGTRKPRTTGVKETAEGITRYHICRACGQQYHSRELDPRTGKPVPRID